MCIYFILLHMQPHPYFTNENKMIKTRLSTQQIILALKRIIIDDWTFLLVFMRLQHH